MRPYIWVFVLSNLALQCSFAAEITVTVEPEKGVDIEGALIVSVFRDKSGIRDSVQEFSFDDTDNVTLRLIAGESVNIYIMDQYRRLMPRHYGPFSTASKTEQAFTSPLRSVEMQGLMAAKDPKVPKPSTVMKATLAKLPPDSKEAQELEDWIETVEDTPGPPKAMQQPPVRVLIPAYFFPSLDGTDTAQGLMQWRELIRRGNADCQVMAVINPADGPIARNEPAGEPWRVKCYQSMLREARANRNIQFLMYLPLAKKNKTAAGDWKVRSEVELDADVQAWIQNYPLRVHKNIAGFFLDEHPSSDPVQTKAARTFRQKLSKVYPKAKIFLNLGRTSEDFRFLENSDNEVAVFLEQSSDFAAANLPDSPSWLRNGEGKTEANRGQFAALLHGADGLSANLIRELSNGSDEKLPFGWIYITHESTSGQEWNRLSSHWQTLTKEIGQLNRSIRK